MLSSVKGKWWFLGALVVLTSGCSLFYPSDVRSYANDMGVSYSEAQNRLSIQIEISLLNTELIKDTENFGGLYTRCSSFHS